MFFSLPFCPDIAMYGLFIVSAPIIAITIYSKNGMVADTWIKLYLEYNYLYKEKRTYSITKRNKILSELRGIKKNVSK